MLENGTTTVLADEILPTTAPVTWDRNDSEFVLFSFLLCVWLLFYLAGSPHILGLIAKLILKRFILSKLSILEHCTFDIGTVSIAWLSGTIFAHKIEIRTQQFVILIVESRLSFFWWNLPNNIRSNDSFKELVDENKPHRLQLKLVGLECILYANKARFEALRKIVESQQFDQSKQTTDASAERNPSHHDRMMNDEIIIETERDIKSPSDRDRDRGVQRINTDRSEHSGNVINHNDVNKTEKSTERSQRTDHKTNDDDDDLDDVSLGDAPTISVDPQHPTRQQSVTVSLQENTGFLTMKKNVTSDRTKQPQNVLLDELRRGIEGVAPNLFFDLCPVTRIGFERVCIVIGNLNVESYLVGSFRESEMVFFTKRNDPESSMHPFKYSVCGKMWELNVAFHKNDDFKHDLVNLMAFPKPRSRIAEADYISDSIGLFNRLLTNRNTDKNAEHSHKGKRNRKDKVQIGPLTQETLESNVPTHVAVKDKMRAVQEHAAMSRTSSGGDSSRRSSRRSKGDKSKRGKRSSRREKGKSRSRNKKQATKGMFGHNNNGNVVKDKKKRINSSSKTKTNVNSINSINSVPPPQASLEGAPHGMNQGQYGYNTVRPPPPSTKTGGSSVTTNDDQKTFITHSSRASHYTHSSQRSHHPYSYQHGPLSHKGSFRHHHGAGSQGVHSTHITNTTHTTDNMLSSGEEANYNGNTLEIAESQNNLNVPALSTTSSQRRVLKINTDTASQMIPSGSPHSPNETASTPPTTTGGFMPRMYSVCIVLVYFFVILICI